MALAVNHPFDEVQVSCSTVDATTGKTGVTRAPFRGVIKKVGSMVGGVLSTADATVTVSVAGVAVTGGAYVITSAASAAGTLGSSVPSGANTCNEDDAISFAQTGSGTAGGHVTHFAVIRRA